MNTKVICLFLALIAASAPDDAGTSCSDKAILIGEGESLTYSKYANYDRVYHGIASCYSLTLDETVDENKLCCYIKNHFKSKEVDKKFTHKGCIPVSYEKLNNGIDNYIKELKTNIEGNDTNITKVDIDIDCSSNFIKLTGLLLIAFLL